MNAIYTLANTVEPVKITSTASRVTVLSDTQVRSVRQTSTTASPIPVRMVADVPMESTGTPVTVQRDTQVQTVTLTLTNAA